MNSLLSRHPVFSAVGTTKARQYRLQIRRVMKYMYRPVLRRYKYPRVPFFFVNPVTNYGGSIRRTVPHHVWVRPITQS